MASVSWSLRRDLRTRLLVHRVCRFCKITRLDATENLRLFAIEVLHTFFYLAAATEERLAECGELSTDVLEHLRPRSPEGDGLLRH
jgi:hypothetical protein